VTELLNTLTTTWLQQHFDAIVWPQEVGAVFCTRTPAFTSDTEAKFATYLSIEDIDPTVEWVYTYSVANPIESIYARKVNFSGTVGVQFVDSGGNPVSIDSPTPVGWQFFPSPPFTSVQEVVVAVIFYLRGTVLGQPNPILFATTQGMGEGTVVHDDAIYGQFQNFEVTRGNVRVLTVDTTLNPPSFLATYLLLKPALPAWEGAHAQHLWLEPQRTNLIVNPS
jgi:hypothetical protein